MVGLHLLPMAYGIPFRRFYIVAAVLILAALIGALMQQPAGSILTGIASGLALWGAAAIALGASPKPA